jgi:hypothetical protein
MATLDAVGRLKTYTTFPQTLDPNKIVRRMASLAGLVYLPGMYELARANGRRDLALRIGLALRIARLRAWGKKMVQRVDPSFRDLGL